MIIESIELKDFRNYEGLDIRFSPRTNIIFGDNAQGKTNILEAAYVSGTSKSHKGSKDKEMIRFGCEEAHIRTKVLKNSREYQIDIHLRKNRKKGAAIDRMPIRKVSDLLGILNIVFFSPEDLNIIKNGPSERRRFIDVELCQLDKIYLSDLSNYNKVLAQRNMLLKDLYHHPELKGTLDVWDEQLLTYGKKIISRREKFTARLAPIMQELHGMISGGREDLIAAYEPNVTAGDFEKKLQSNRNRDMKQAQTSVGPHRDDIRFKIKDIDIRRFGSQGQQRSCALSLKLSEIKLVEQATGEMPVLLLDDVLSELDANRQNYLLDNLNQTQTIITCTGLDEFVRNRFEMNKVFKVVSGSVSEME
ncbi:MAG: DNA replication/repair protein RecF [Lachnospiraceae bacterium]|nr:DNA replication/repair protein RecF [Lachnospiraceae bacterium]